MIICVQLIITTYVGTKHKRVDWKIQKFSKYVYRRDDKMGADARGKIKGEIEFKEVLEFIRKNYDKNSAGELTVTTIYSNDGSSHESRGIIQFIFNDKPRTLYYSYDNAGYLPDSEEEEEKEVTNLTMEYDKDNVESITRILMHFGGGWLDEDDSDDEDYRPMAPDTI